MKNKLWLVGVMVVLVILGTWMGYRWLRGAWAGLLVDSRQTYEEASALGRTLTATACIDTAFARHARLTSSSLGQQFTENLFVEGCLRWSTPTVMCDSVPKVRGVREMLHFSVWSTEQCNQRGLHDRNCPHLLQPLIAYCERQKTKVPDAK
jgi:hypothetical protein